MSNELKPCPFCGNPAKAHIWETHTADKFAGVECSKCPAEIAWAVHWHDSGENELPLVIAAWNRRTPEALAASPEVKKLVAEAETRGMERAAKLVPTGYTFWAKKPHNARWARKIDGTPIPNDLPVCIQEIIHAEAAAIRRAEGEPT